MTLPQTSPPLTYAIGRVENPPAYYDVLTPAGGTAKPPVVMIHGGAHTGAGYLVTPDGRPGWAHVFVRAGYRVVVPDWPGRGRSGHIPLDAINGDLIAAISRPAYRDKSCCHGQPIKLKITACH